MSLTHYSSAFVFTSASEDSKGHTDFFFTEQYFSSDMLTIFQKEWEAQANRNLNDAQTDANW